MAAVHSETLTSLAILKVSADRGRDYIDYFVPFIAEAIRINRRDVIALPEIQADVRERFGLDIPPGPLRTVLDRALREGVLRRDGQILRAVPERIDELRFEDARLV